jgi:hypothetical protein
MGEITYLHVRANLESRLASEEFQAIERLNHLPGRRLTTARTIAAEEEILRRVREAKTGFSQSRQTSRRSELPKIIRNSTGRRRWLSKTSSVQPTGFKEFRVMRSRQDDSAYCATRRG